MVLLRPRPAFSQIVSAMADICVPANDSSPRRGLARTAPFRVGPLAFFLPVRPGCPSLRLSVPPRFAPRFNPCLYYGIDNIQFSRDNRKSSAVRM